MGRWSVARSLIKILIALVEVVHMRFNLIRVWAGFWSKMGYNR